MAVQEPTNIRLAFDAGSLAEQAPEEDLRSRGTFEPAPGAPALEQAEAVLLKATEARVRRGLRRAGRASNAATEAKRALPRRSAPAPTPSRRRSPNRLCAPSRPPCRKPASAAKAQARGT
jgi:hypothetical protein